ncbi:MAG: hypothetical protein ACK5RG_03085 [Cyclobacteriaceae bacterium]|jgi:hypothetical protein|nr:hypothetical protein [Flammeovirgaceae bacterium]
MKMLMIFFLAINCGIVSGQTPEKTQKESIKKLSWLLGEWSGTGVVNMGGKKNIILYLRESVRPSLDSTIYIINGQGFERDSLTKKDVMVHDAFAVVSFDERQNRFRWNAWRIPGGTYGDLAITLGDKSFEWSTNVQGGQTRYKARLNEKGQWIEVGEFSKDGIKWFEFITLTLDKKLK